MRDTLTTEMLLEMVEQFEPPIVKQLREITRKMAAAGKPATHLIVHTDHRELGGEAARWLNIELLASPAAFRDQWFLIHSPPLSLEDDRWRIGFRSPRAL